MKRLVFALAGTAALGVAGCGSSNQDQVNNAEMNQPSADELNQLANDAANDAANTEAAALGKQQQQLENRSRPTMPSTRATRRSKTSAACKPRPMDDEPIPAATLIVVREAADGRRSC